MALTRVGVGGTPGTLLGSILPTVWTAGSIAAAQAALLASAQAVDLGIQKCGTYPATKKTEWNAWLAAVTVFCKLVPVYIATSDNEVSVFFASSFADQLQQHQAELLAYQQSLSNPIYKGCDFPPVPPTPGSTLMSALEWAVIGVGFIATAVIVTKIAREVELFRPKSAQVA
jgi:hypothetical protein